MPSLLTNQKQVEENIFIMGGYSEVSGMQCDLCGKRKGSGKTVNSVYLCSGCLKDFELKPAYIRKIIERFLIGNVC